MPRAAGETLKEKRPYHRGLQGSGWRLSGGVGYVHFSTDRLEDYRSDGSCVGLISQNSLLISDTPTWGAEGEGESMLPAAASTRENGGGDSCEPSRGGGTVLRLT